MMSPTSPDFKEIYDHMNPGAPKATKPPPTVFCYLCGRLFGSKSISIHEPKCLEKWERENEQLPQELQKNPPQKPDAVKNEKGGVDIDATNRKIWNECQQNMVECDFCKRRFNVERMPIHGQSCTANNPAE